MGRHATTTTLLVLTAAFSAPPSRIVTRTHSINLALTAVVVTVRGNVRIQEPASAAGSTPRETSAARGRILAEGMVISVPAGASVAIVCSTDRFVRLESPVAWKLSPLGCDRGRELPAGAYRSLATDRGRVVTNAAGSAVFVRSGSRGWDVSPVISPRGWELADRPYVEWVLDPGAAEYQVTLSTGDSDSTIDSLIIRAESLPCEPRDDEVFHLRTCRMPWPFPAPLKRDTTFYRLSVTARADSTEIRATARLRLVPGLVAERLASRLARIGDLELDSVSEALLAGAALADDSLFGEAAEHYRRAFAAAPSPELEVTLGDLSRADSVSRMARLWYQAAAADAARAGNLAAEAAARQGFGLVLFEDGSFAEAEIELTKASVLFTRLGWNDQAAGADSAAVLAGQERARVKPR